MDQVVESQDKALNILIYGLNYAPEIIGVGRYTGDIGQHLSSSGHNVRVVTSAPHYPAWAVEPPYSALSYKSEFHRRTSIIRCPIVVKAKMHGVWRLLAPLSFAISSAPVVIWLILRHRPDLVLCVEPTLLAAPVALIAAKFIGSRTVLHVQDLEIDAAFAVGHLRSNLARRTAVFFEQRVLRGFDRIISISNKMRERLVLKGVDSERIAMIRNWTDLDRIQPLVGQNTFRLELDLPDGAFVVLYSGSIGIKHALSMVLDAASCFAEQKKPIIFVIVGEGPEKLKLIERYGHLPNVRFLPLQPEDRLCELLNLADLHVLPQDKGIADMVLPSKLGGMLASGRPILVTADAGTELFDVLKGTTIIVPAGDKDAMAREISVLAEQGCHPALGDGRKLAELFSKKACLQQFQTELAGPKKVHRRIA